MNGIWPVIYILCIIIQPFYTVSLYKYRKERIKPNCEENHAGHEQNFSLVGDI